MGHQEPDHSASSASRSDEPVQPASPADGPDDPGYEIPKQKWLVHGSIIVAFALFFSMLMFLYVRWSNAPESTSTLVFFGNETLAGVQVTVEGLRLDEPMTQQFSAANKYNLHFPLSPGTYEVRIVKDGVRLTRDTAITMRDGVGQEYDLGHFLKVTTAPTTQVEESKTP